MAKYFVFVLPSAEKEIRKISKVDQFKILTLIKSLEDNPRPKGCKKLIGVDAWRVRIGVYRVIYSIQDKILQIEIIRVAHRKEVYK